MTKLLGVDQGREQWMEAWRRTGSEPFAHPDYVALLAKGIGRPACLWSTSAADDAIFPLIVRDIPGGSPSDLRDAVSPYGYGGPYFSGTHDTSDFFRSLRDIIGELGFVSLFGRLSLRTDASAADGIAGMRTSQFAKNVIVDLTRSHEDQWRHYDRKVRKNVNKALRGGLRVSVDTCFSNVDEFAALYLSTMRRRSAGTWYEFDAFFFSALLSALPGSVIVAEVRDADGLLVSGEVLLANDHTLYSFLGGTHREAFPMAPNDLLKHAVIQHGHDLGADSYVLGGGYTDGDGIYRYKLAFDPDGSTPFFGLQAIGNCEQYAQLTMAHLASAGLDATESSNYFPAYRAPLEALPASSAGD